MASSIHSEATQLINAPIDVVYGIMTDYEVGHPAILPKQYFKNVRVEKGGRGAGTVITVDVEVYGVKRSFYMQVSEPEPGRVLMEVDEAQGVYTTFSFKPVNAQQTQVTISSEIRPSKGVQGFFEKLFNPAINRRIYKEELDILNRYAQGSQTAR